MEVLSLPGGPGIGDTQSYQGPLTARLCSMSYPNHRFFVQRRYGGSLLRFASTRSPDDTSAKRAFGNRKSSPLRRRPHDPQGTPVVKIRRYLKERLPFTSPFLDGTSSIQIGPLANVMGSPSAVV
jgi:hypothetical protein